MRFQVLVSYDEENSGYVVDVPELPGCMSQGKTVVDALANVRDAIRGVLFVNVKYGGSHGPIARRVLIAEVAV